MREIISNKDIGTTIDFRTQGPYEAKHPWPEETVVSAGNGIVFSRDPEKPGYTTLFMEVYPPGHGFIRGEGATPEECEDACWRKYQQSITCPGTDSGEHEIVPAGYTNGAGLCKHCRTFRSNVFTGEDLGQYCRRCGQGTVYHRGKDEDTQEVFWLCQDCFTPEDSDLPQWFKDLVGDDLEDPAKEASDDE